MGFTTLRIAKRVQKFYQRFVYRLHHNYVDFWMELSVEIQTSSLPNDAALCNHGTGTDCELTK
jgi:hypothetical protein